MDTPTGPAGHYCFRFGDAVPESSIETPRQQGRPGDRRASRIGEQSSPTNSRALRVLDELHRRRKAGYVPPAAFLNAYLGLGDTEEAFT